MRTRHSPVRTAEGDCRTGRVRCTRRIWSQRRKKSESWAISVDTFRVTYATLLTGNGEDVKGAQELTAARKHLGHSESLCASNHANEARCAEPSCEFVLDKNEEKPNNEAYRADAAFAKPEIYEALEERGMKYAIRLSANASLLPYIEALLKRPGEGPVTNPLWYKVFLYQAASWKTARRVVAKVEFSCWRVVPTVGIHRTNLETTSRAVVRFYNKRGTAERGSRRGSRR